ncbi:hypothetical protein RIF29_09500 [Crotalaria pallida]|uniref:Uncharacterized protein n=1 Tax=Crotalaria pallida TaxID=3830 RepID=A0AAN9IJN8_CROPI
MTAILSPIFPTHFLAHFPLNFSFPSKLFVLISSQFSRFSLLLRVTVPSQFSHFTPPLTPPSTSSSVTTASVTTASFSFCLHHHRLLQPLSRISFNRFESSLFFAGSFNLRLHALQPQKIAKSQAMD